MEYLTNYLRAYDCIYHQKCSVNFRTGKYVPNEFCVEVKGVKKGRPQNDIQNDAFLETCMFIVNNDKEQYEIAEIVEIMACYLNASIDVDSSLTPYSSKYMKKKLVETYCDSISISGGGKGDVVMMQETVRKILRNYHDQPDPLTEEEKYKIITPAAKLIKSDIKKENKKKCNGKVEHYPLKAELCLENALKYLPESSKCFFKNLFVGKDTSRKIAGIGQSTIAGSMSPTFVGTITTWVINSGVPPL